MTNVKKLVVLPIIAILLSLVGVVALQSSYVQAQFDPIGEACANVPDTESAPAVCSNRDTTDNPVSGENGTLQKSYQLVIYGGGCCVNIDYNCCWADDGIVLWRSCKSSILSRCDNLCCNWPSCSCTFTFNNNIHN